LLVVEALRPDICGAARALSAVLAANEVANCQLHAAMRSNDRHDTISIKSLQARQPSKALRARSLAARKIHVEQHNINRPARK
jgi:hypothetical protein